MNSEIKKTIAASISIFILIVAYYGSYLPLRKSMIFIESMHNAGNMRTINDFEQNFSVALDAPSPIGQEELVRSMTNMIANSFQNVPDPKGIDELVKFVGSYYGPIVKRDRGMSFGQDIYILGAMNEFAFLKTGEKKYLADAESYFKHETELGPKRPQGLYGLLDVYRMEGNFDSFKVVAAQVMSQWPDDTRTKGMIDQVSKLISEQGAKK